MTAGTEYDIVVDGNPFTETADFAGNITLTGIPAGTYNNITVSADGCTSNEVGPVTLTDPATPSITLGATAGPSTCSGNDGSITLTGLMANEVYTITYTSSVTGTNTINALADLNGTITFNGLQAATYSDIFVTIDDCDSNVLGLSLIHI